LRFQGSCIHISTSHKASSFCSTVVTSQALKKKVHMPEMLVSYTASTMHYDKQLYV